MDRSKTAELMPILWRLGTGKVYLDYSRTGDLAAVAEMGGCVVPLLTERLEDDCRILRSGAAIALRHIFPAVPSPASQRLFGDEGEVTQANDAPGVEPRMFHA